MRSLHSLAFLPGWVSVWHELPGMVCPVGEVLARASSTADLAVPNGLGRCSAQAPWGRLLGKEICRVMRTWRTGLAGRKDEIKVGLAHWRLEQPIGKLHTL